jgi:hypothetical protein
MSPALALRTAEDRINPAALALGDRGAILSPARNRAIRRPFLRGSARCCIARRDHSMKNLILAGLILAGLAACTTSSPPPAEPAAPAPQIPAETPPPAPAQ